MVKESERKRTYHPRGSHKEGCMCVVCKANRPPLVEPEVIVRTPPPLPTEVRLDSLPSATKFIFGGQEHRIGQKFEGMVVTYILFTDETVILGGATKVKPIK